jgi:tRNA pseudouridine38-40 synthase
MPRFFIEVAYKGTNYAGFQKQDNANTIQAEVEKALEIYFREVFDLTGSSRTDAGVHARQNFFHFDTGKIPVLADYTKTCYHLNAILPADIVVNALLPVSENAHCRFDALSRTYQYTIYQRKDPFMTDMAFYYPYRLDFDLLESCALEVKNHTDFESFSKRNTQVYTYTCGIVSSYWSFNRDNIQYNVCANRFLRGMVKGLVGTMLKVATKKQTPADFAGIIRSKNPALANFAIPSHGLTLLQVQY